MRWRLQPILPYLVIFLGAFLTAGGALWAAWSQNADSRRLLGQVTGGDSFVYLEPLRQSTAVRYFVRQFGDYPTYDVAVTVQEIVIDEGRRARKKIFGPAEMGRIFRRGSLEWTYSDDLRPDLQPDPWPLVFPTPPGPGAVSKEFRVELAARNGVFIQRLRVWPEGDRWHTESRRLAGLPDGVDLPEFLEAHNQPVTPENRLQDDARD